MAKLAMGGNYTVWEPADVRAWSDSSLRAEIALWRDVHAIGNKREQRHAAMQMKVLWPEAKKRGIDQ